VLNSITPFFIVDDLQATLEFYQSRLGFAVLYHGGDDSGDFWAFVGRDQVMLMFKSIAPDVHPQPNSSRHPWARWDAYILTSDPDALYQEFVAKSVPMHLSWRTRTTVSALSRSSTTTATSYASAVRSKNRAAIQTTHANPTS
jgi:hypothetical protein